MDPKQPNVLWKALNDDGYYTKSQAEFEKQFSTPEAQEALWGKLNEAELYTKGFDEFQTQFFSKKKEPSGQPSGTSSVTPLVAPGAGKKSDVLKPWETKPAEGPVTKVYREPVKAQGAFVETVKEIPTAVKMDWETGKITTVAQKPEKKVVVSAGKPVELAEPPRYEYEDEKAADYWAIFEKRQAWAGYDFENSALTYDNAYKVMREESMMSPREKESLKQLRTKAGAPIEQIDVTKPWQASQPGPLLPSTDFEDQATMKELQFMAEALNKENAQILNGLSYIEGELKKKGLDPNAIDALIAEYNQLQKQAEPLVTSYSKKNYEQQLERVAAQLDDPKFENERRVLEQMNGMTEQINEITQSGDYVRLQELNAELNRIPENDPMRNSIIQEYNRIVNSPNIRRLSALNAEYMNLQQSPEFEKVQQFMDMSSKVKQEYDQVAGKAKSESAAVQAKLDEIKAKSQDVLARIEELKESDYLYSEILDFKRLYNINVQEFEKQLSSGRYANVQAYRQMLADIQQKEDDYYRDANYFTAAVAHTGRVILHSLAKVPEMIGTIADLTEKSFGLEGDKQGLADYAQEWLKNISTDILNATPAPTNLNRGLMTTTVQYGDYQVDVDDNKIVGIRDQDGYSVNLVLNQEEQDEILRMPRETKINVMPFAYQTASTVGDVALQVLSGRLMGLPKLVPTIQRGQYVTALKFKPLGSSFGLTMANIGMMGNQLYEDGLRNTNSPEAAARYALGTSAMIGAIGTMSGFGIEERLLKVGKFNIPSLDFGKNLKNGIAKTSYKFFAGGAGETLEEEVIEPLLTAGTQLIANRFAGGTFKIEELVKTKNELVSDAAISIMTGGLLEVLRTNKRTPITVSNLMQAANDVKTAEEAVMTLAAMTGQELTEAERKNLNVQIEGVREAVSMLPEEFKNDAEAVSIMMDIREINTQIEQLSKPTGVEAVDTQNQAKVQELEAKKQELNGQIKGIIDPTSPERATRIDAEMQTLDPENPADKARMEQLEKEKALTIPAVTPVVESVEAAPESAQQAIPEPTEAEVMAEPMPTYTRAALPEGIKTVRAKNATQLENVMGIMFGLDAPRAKAVATVMDRMIAAMAKRNGITTEEMYQRIRFTDAESESVQMAEDSNFIIGVMTDNTLASPLNAFAKVFEHYLTNEERAAVQQMAGTTAWDDTTSKKFAAGFQKYLKTGEAPIRGLQGVFNKFKNWLTDVYNGIKGTDIEVSDRVKQLYDQMLNVKVQQPTARPISEVQEAEIKEAQLALDKAQRQFDNLEKINPDAQYPIFNVGNKLNEGDKVIIEDSRDERNDRNKEGIAVITKVIEPAAFDADGRMTKAAVVQSTIFDSKEQADQFIRDKYNKYKATAQERLNKAKENLANAQRGGIGKPAIEAPPTETPEGEEPAAEMPEGEAPVTETPEGEAPMAEAPAGEPVTEATAEEPPAERVETAAQNAGISPKNMMDLVRVNMQLFGQGSEQALAAAVIMDKMVEMMAKRAKISKEAMYGRLNFQKGDEQYLRSLNSRGRMLWQLIGENAQLSDNVRANLQVARDMEAAGKDAKSIRIATGWEKGKDGKWRYEIEDVTINADALDRLRNGESVKLSELVGVDSALLKAYPQFNDITVSPDTDNESIGSWNPEKREIKLSYSILGTGGNDLATTIVHEIQHAVQGAEGFAAGGNIPLGAIELIKTLRSIYQSLDNEIDDYNLSLRILRDPDNHSKKDVANAIKKVKQINDKYNKKYKGTPIEGKGLLGFVNYLTDTIDELYKNPESHPLAYRTYLKIAGEVEARNVEKRLAMTPEQRRTTPLTETEDVAREEQIVLFQMGIPAGIRFQIDAWHGSPYLFDKFTTEKIGTGEGAQVYGWGLYFTDVKGIADWYAKTLGGVEVTKPAKVENSIIEYIKKTLGIKKYDDKIIDRAIKRIKDWNGNKEKAIEYAEYDLSVYEEHLKQKSKYTDRDVSKRMWKEDLNRAKNMVSVLKKEIQALKELEFKSTGVLYSTSLFKGKSPSEYLFLDWDITPSDNAIKIIEDKLKELGIDAPVDILYGDATDGSKLYKYLSGVFGSDKEASLFLLRAGIDGIRYPSAMLSGGTRETSDGFNYVVFDENAVSIEEVIRFQREANTARGAVMVNMDGQAIIYALTDPNVSTPIHELAHVFEHYLTNEERQNVIDWAGTDGWTVETSEKFARGFERYLAEGKAPTPAIQDIFDKFKQWLTDIYNGITGSDIDIELNDTMKNLYAQMLTGQAPPSRPTVEGDLKPQGSAVLERFVNRYVNDPSMPEEAREEVRANGLTRYTLPNAYVAQEANKLYQAIMDYYGEEAGLKQVVDYAKQLMTEFIQDPESPDVLANMAMASVLLVKAAYGYNQIGMHRAAAEVIAVASKLGVGAGQFIQSLADQGNEENVMNRVWGQLTTAQYEALKREGTTKGKTLYDVVNAVVEELRVTREDLANALQNMTTTATQAGQQRAQRRQTGDRRQRIQRSREEARNRLRDSWNNLNNLSLSNTPQQQADRWAQLYGAIADYLVTFLEEGVANVQELLDKVTKDVNEDLQITDGDVQLKKALEQKLLTPGSLRRRNFPTYDPDNLTPGQQAAMQAIEAARAEVDKAETDRKRESKLADLYDAVVKFMNETYVAGATDMGQLLKETERILGGNITQEAVYYTLDPDAISVEKGVTKRMRKVEQEIIDKYLAGKLPKSLWAAFMDAGFNEKTAKEMEAAIKEEVKKIQKKKIEKALKVMQKQLEEGGFKTNNRKLDTVMERLIAASGFGLLTEQSVIHAMSSYLGYPAMTQQEMDKVIKMSKDVFDSMFSKSLSEARQKQLAVFLREMELKYGKHTTAILAREFITMLVQGALSGFGTLVNVLLGSFVGGVYVTARTAVLNIPASWSALKKAGIGREVLRGFKYFMASFTDNVSATSALYGTQSYNVQPSLVEDALINGMKRYANKMKTGETFGKKAAAFGQWFGTLLLMPHRISFLIQGIDAIFSQSLGEYIRYVDAYNKVMKKNKQEELATKTKYTGDFIKAIDEYGKFSNEKVKKAEEQAQAEIDDLTRKGTPPPNYWKQIRIREIILESVDQDNKQRVKEAMNLALLTGEPSGLMTGQAYRMVSRMLNINDNTNAFDAIIKAAVTVNVGLFLRVMANSVNVVYKASLINLAVDPIISRIATRHYSDSATFHAKFVGEAEAKKYPLNKQLQTPGWVRKSYEEIVTERSLLAFNIALAVILYMDMFEDDEEGNMILRENRRFDLTLNPTGLTDLEAQLKDLKPYNIVMRGDTTKPFNKQGTSMAYFTVLLPTFGILAGMRDDLKYKNEEFNKRNMMQNVENSVFDMFAPLANFSFNSPSRFISEIQSGYREYLKAREKDEGQGTVVIGETAALATAPMKRALIGAMHRDMYEHYRLYNEKRMLKAESVKENMMRDIPFAQEYIAGVRKDKYGNEFYQETRYAGIVESMTLGYVDFFTANEQLLQRPEWKLERKYVTAKIPPAYDPAKRDHKFDREWEYKGVTYQEGDSIPVELAKEMVTQFESLYREQIAENYDLLNEFENDEMYAKAIKELRDICIDIVKKENAVSTTRNIPQNVNQYIIGRLQEIRDEDSALEAEKIIK